mgnify:CR=1 FL=1
MSYEKYLALYGDKFIQQLELETLAKQEAEEHLRKTLDTIKTEGEAGQGHIASSLIKYTWETCRSNIHALVQQVKENNTRGVKSSWFYLMEDLLTIYANKEDTLEDLLVLTGHSVIIDCLLMTSKERCKTLSYIAVAIGTALKKEADIEKFYKYEETKGADMKWLKSSMDKAIEQRARTSYKVAYAVNRMHKEGYTGLNWSTQDMNVLGAKIIEMLIAGSDFYILVDKQIDTKTIKCLEVGEWFAQAWQKQEAKLISNAVKHLPTIIPPRHWSSPYDGGYYGASCLHTQLIRLNVLGGAKAVKTYTNKLAMVDLGNIYATLNAMQDTPFRINKDILNTLKEIYASGGVLGGVPRTEPFEKLPRLPEDATEEEIKEHKKKAVGIYKQEEARKSKALRCLVALNTAERFAEYDSIYFPWNVDYRGRCYPIPTALSPQGDDIQKSLLLFAKGTPLASNEDTKWLKIHGANLSGNDKISFKERIAWVEAHETDIVNSANDPLGYQWWYEVSQGDYPMEFLAFCFEYKKLLTYVEKYGNAKGFVSDLPLAFDGTCSGLQHFSALLRDEVGGQAVNLMPSDTVQDIYSIVANKVNKLLIKDALEGTEDSFKTNKDGEVMLDREGKPMVKHGTKMLAQNWVNFNRIKFGQDGITRKVCKRSVMTLAYGSKQYGFKENLLADIIHPYVLDHPENNPFISPAQAAVYMASLIWDSVKTTVIKAVEGMEWLQKVADLICYDNHVVTWNTPNGFPVQQNYMKMKQETIQLRFNKARVRFYNQRETDDVDNRAQRNGIAPNFIHSMDACHLQRVVNAMKQLGDDNFMMIHDSFGTDCAHAGLLYKVIRQEFVNLYKDQNHLANFLESVKYLIGDDKLSKVPEIPAFGKLDLDLVTQSDFCFA